MKKATCILAISVACLAAACSRKAIDATKGGTVEGPAAPGGAAATGNSAETGAVDAEGVAAVAALQEKIRSDPRISSQQIQVTFKPPITTYPRPQIEVAGHLATDEERVAVMNDAREVTDLDLSFTLPVDRTESLRAASSDAASASWTEPDRADAPMIPLCAGLTVVTAIGQPSGDYESIKTIESVDTKEVRLKYSSESSPPWWSTPHPQLTQTTTHRTVLTADLESAHRYDQIFVEKVPETSPGTTAIGTSAAVLRELKAKGESAFAICGSADESSEMDSDRQLHQAPGGCHSYGRNTPITRVGDRPVSLRVLVDGAPVELPAIRAVRGVASEGTRDEFFFLDDERNPLTLSFRLGADGVKALTPHERHLCDTDGKNGNLTLTGDGWPPSCDLPHGGDGETLRVVQITTECMTPAATSRGGRGAGGTAADGESSGARALERALAEKGTVDIYSIYFSFNSDTIRDESQSTLEDIAEVMRWHPDWKLRVDGHTDSVGDDAYNLDLSKRRSAAVKAALVKQYQVSPPRLTTDGYGETRPKDTNDTLDGRGHNRRVELVKVG